MKDYQIIAHTGCEDTPYNSVDSCRVGYEAGAEVLEVDVRVTRDGVAVLYHDDEPDVSQYTIEEWVAAGYEPIEKLETVLELFAGKPVMFNLDLKTMAAYEAAFAVVDELKVWNQVYFTGVTDHLAHGDRAKHVIWNMPDLPPECSDAFYEQEVTQFCDYAKQAGFAGMNVHYTSCRPSLVKQAKERGLSVWLYTLAADEALLRRYVDMGVDAVSVFDVTTCVEMRARWLADAVSEREI